MLLAGQISHTNIQYVDLSKFSLFRLIFLLFILPILVGVALRMCIIVTLC